MTGEPFDAKNYAVRVMRTRGYMLKRMSDGTFVDTDPDVMAVFGLQFPSWKALFEKHRIDADPERAEHLLTSFGHREVIGGASKVLETFAAHLDAQPRQGGSPDWSKAGREWTECAYCDGRGVVSEVPCLVIRHGDEVERKFSFACVCDAGRRFAGMKVAEDWMIRFAADRKSREIATHKEKLIRFGVDPDADPKTRATQFRRAFATMRSQVGRDGQTARTVRPMLPRSVDEARTMLAGRHIDPPEHLDPEAMALAAYANGDERNEWE